MTQKGSVSPGSAGKWLFGIGALHTLVGVVIAGRWVADPALERVAAERLPLRELLRGGVVFDGAPDPLLIGFFWFFFFGFAILLLGLGVDALERARVNVPVGLVVGLALLALLGVVAMPASGFWLVAIPLTLLVRERTQLRSLA